MVKKKKAPKPPKKDKKISKKTAPSPKSKKKSAVSSQASTNEPLNSLGKKFTCHSCNTKFYDLNKPDKICPKCGADQNAKPATKQKNRSAKVSEYDVTDEEISEIPDELIGEGEEIEMDEEAVLDEEEV